MDKMENVNKKPKVLPVLNKPPSVLLVAATYYPDITDKLIEGALQVLKKVNTSVEKVEVPGALEIPTAIKFASDKFSGFVALGCVIRGETSHYETVTSDSSRALSHLGLAGLCIGNGILTVENREQAINRADPLGQNKGGGAAEALISLIAIKEKFSLL